MCLKKAKYYSGHVINRHGVQITAGWCLDHIDTIPDPDLLGRTGCFGGYHKRYGVKKVKYL